MTRANDSQKPNPDHPESLAARLCKKYGKGVDPEVSLGGEPSGAPSGATEELLKRLEQHGVNAPRYKLEGEIARGGMGAILRVWDGDLRRHLAMKMVLGKGDGGTPAGEVGDRVATPQVDAKVLARFLEEAQVTSQLDHPGIVPVHELGLDADGQVYFTMKLVKGRDLKHVFDLVFEGKDGWNETRALGVILKACEAMAYAHKKGVIHRDLKPANVMVGSYGEVFVMDWGLARVLGRKDTHDIRLNPESVPNPSSALTSVKTERREEREDAPDSPLVTMDGDVMGTPAYMPPEQARGEIEKLSQGSDVYSIGAMLYHLLARQIPYVPPGTRMTNRTVLARVLEGPPKALHDINKEVPVELVAICEKAMRRDATARYADTLDLAEDLRAYLEGRVVSAYETGAIAEFRKWVARNRGIAAASTAALITAIFGLAWNSHIQSSARKDIEDKNQELRVTNVSLDQERKRAQAEEARAKANEHTARENEERAKQQSYVANLVAADASLRANEGAEAERRLDACDPSLRGWEWRYLRLATPNSLAVLRGHAAPVMSVTFSPDGSRIASASQDRAVRVWDASSGENLLKLMGHEGWVTSVAYSTDGSRIASASGDKTVRVWSGSNGENLLVLRGHEEYVTSVAFSPDGSRIASGSADEAIRLWNATSGESVLVLRGHDAGIEDVAFNPDASRLASASMDGTVRVWDAQDGEILLILRGHEAQLFSVAFSPDGSRIASASADETVRVWNAITGESQLVLRGRDGWGTSVAFSPDGSRIASGSFSAVQVWDATTGETLLVLRRHDMAVNAVAFSPDGSRIVSASDDSTIRVWSATGDENVLVLRGHDSRVASIAFSPDSSRIVSASPDESVRVWNASSGENLLTLRGHEGWVTSVAFSPDGSRIASTSTDETVRMWNASSGEHVRVLGGGDGQIQALAFSPDGSRIATASFDNTHDGAVSVWDTISGERQLVLPGGRSWISSLAFSPDGSRIALTDEHDKVGVYSASSGEKLLVLRGHERGVQSVAFSADGARMATAAGDKTVRLWDSSSGENLLTLRGHDGGVTSVALSPDGSRIASASDDKTVRVWNASTGEGLLVLRGHEATVRFVSFSPDGSRIASASDDKTIRVWDTSATAVHDPSRSAVNAASRLVQGRVDRLVLVEHVIEDLRTDTSLREDVRSLAIRLAGLHQSDPERLNEASWLVVIRPHGDPTAYERAARMAEVACEMRPDRGSYLKTLGIAQYRMGQYERAIATLTRSDELNSGKQPGDAAFLAMTQRQVGNAEAAQVELMRLRVLVQDPRWKKDMDVKSMVEEAEALIAEAAASKPDGK